MKFLWTTVNVNDMEKSLDFYQEIVGLKVQRRIKPNPDMEIAFLGEGDTQVELIASSDSKPISYSSDISLGFEVASLEVMMDKFKEKKITLHSGPFQPNPFIKFAYILDPDGLKIQFVEQLTSLVEG